MALEQAGGSVDQRQVKRRKINTPQKKKTTVNVVEAESSGDEEDGEAEDEEDDSNDTSVNILQAWVMIMTIEKQKDKINIYDSGAS